LLVIVVLGIVVGVLAQAIVVSAKSTASTTKRFNTSHDAQLASAYLAADVQNTQTLSSATCYPGTPSNNVINFAYTDSSVASYYYGSVSGETALVRRFCDPGGNLTADVTLVHNLSTGTAPTKSCTSPTGCAVGDQPDTVTLGITLSDGYSFNLSGSRRLNTASNPPPGTTGYPPLLALGGTGLTLTATGGGSLTVNGKIIVNSTGTPAVNRNNNSTLNATGGIEIYQGTCSGCTSTNRQLPVPDPLAGLPLPDETGRPVYTDGDPSHGPGVYRATALTFDQNSAPLAPGLYIVESGFNFQGSNTKIAGNGVLLFNGCGLNAPPSCQNNGDLKLTSGDLDLTPINDGSVYAQSKLVIWQPSANSGQVNIGGGSQASSIGGVLYAPTAAVTLSAGGAGLTIGAVIALSVNVTGNGNVTIG
jgi:hypothetical protein